MILINNYQRKTEFNNGPMESREGVPEIKNVLAGMILRCVEQIPPAELSRCLRDFLFLYIMDLKEIPAGFGRQIMDILVLFEELDRAEMK